MIWSTRRPMDRAYRQHEQQPRIAQQHRRVAPAGPVRMRLDRRKRLREKGISPDASEIREWHRAIGGPVAAHREQQAEALRSHHEADRSPQASPRVAVALETPHRLD